MKPYLPHNLLLALTIAVIGLTAFYHFVLRPSYSTAIQYAYPAVEQPAAPSSPEPERFYAPGAGAEDAPAESSRTASARFPLDINAANLEQLKLIPQVGDVLAQRIVQYRDVLGGYTNLEQLLEIKGVGEQTYAHISPYLVVAQGAPETPEPQTLSGSSADG